MKRYRYDVPMRDGIRLVTYVNLPGEGTGPYAVLFSLSPYCAEPAADELPVCELPDDVWAENGFAVVEQHCRGRGGSEGRFVPFENDRKDGLDALAWIEKQPWCDGRIYLTGASYLCYAHLSYMDCLPASVKGASLAVMAANGSLAFWQNGVYKADLLPTWYLMVYHEWDVKNQDFFGAFRESWYQYPMSGYMKRIYGYEVPSFDRLIALRDDPRACPGSYSDVADAMKKCRIPVLLTGGWSEMFLDGMAEMWHDLPEETRSRSVFYLGPWWHTMELSPDSSYRFENGTKPADYELQWLLWLRDGKPMTEFVPGTVRYYQIGRSEWVTAADLPQGETELSLYPAAGGSLSGTVPADGEVTYSFDPADAPFFPGGPNSLGRPPVGFADQPEPDFRPDVKSFLTGPLEEELTVGGRARFELAFRTTADATAFVCRLCCVDHEGHTVVMQDCPMETGTVEPGKEALVSGETGPLCWTLRKGERLRVDIASADSHSYRIHPNYAGDPFRTEKCRTADNTVLFGKTRLVLPVLRAGEE